MTGTHIMIMTLTGFSIMTGEHHRMTSRSRFGPKPGPRGLLRDKRVGLYADQFAGLKRAARQLNTSQNAVIRLAIDDFLRRLPTADSVGNDEMAA